MSEGQALKLRALIKKKPYDFVMSVRVSQSFYSDIIGTI